jgi:hypothetical protein
VFFIILITLLLNCQSFHALRRMAVELEEDFMGGVATIGWHL